MANTTTSPADTPWTAEPSGDGFFRVVNSQSVVLAQKCVKEEAELFALVPELLAFAKLFHSGRGTPSMLLKSAAAAIDKAEGR